uniref:Uncharacterized protein LOC104232023 n=1 Tax=Nicotiana sylvestris TaxID=4096 RepID=A0A1U7WXT5_NICSY|nr:PREDICTED: uncharacterized protein LOC104232023 [Nicotiana sylvestris]
MGWMKRRFTYSVLYDRNVPPRLSGKFYRTVVRPVMLYGAECSPVKKSHVQKMKVAKIGMLRWMYGYTKRDKIRNKVIRDKVGMALVEDKMRELKLRWFGHVRRRDTNTQVRRCESLTMAGQRRDRRRHKKY